MDKVYEFIDGRVKEHLGGVDDFLRRKKADSFRDIEAAPSAAPARAGLVERQVLLGPSAPAGPKKVLPRAEKPEQPKQKDVYQQQKQLSREERRAKNRQNQLEKQIAELEAKMAEIEKVLAAPTPDADIMELTRRYLEYKRDLDARMDEWAAL